MCWDEYWKFLLDDKKLNSKVEEMNEIDLDINGKYMIEDICHKIYDEYPDYYEELQNKRQELLKIVEEFPGVHLQTSRVKKLDSLLKKVIEKRSQYITSDSSLYTNIDGENYKNILTDLTGIRLIISYRGNWLELHNKIVETFPYYKEREAYNKYTFIPHPKDGSSVMAEIPKVYYAYMDDQSIYKGADVETYLKENGYRSVHYVISFQGTYDELQTRTIYDEAWSDFDHNCVYKRESHKSYAALKDMSMILSWITTAASELGEIMNKVYDNELICEFDGKYKIKEGYNLQLNEISDKIGNVQLLLDELNKRLV